MNSNSEKKYPLDEVLSEMDEEFQGYADHLKATNPEKYKRLMEHLQGPTEEEKKEEVELN